MNVVEKQKVFNRVMVSVVGAAVVMSSLFIARDHIHSATRTSTQVEKPIQEKVVVQQPEPVRRTIETQFGTFREYKNGKFFYLYRHRMSGFVAVNVIFPENGVYSGYQISLSCVASNMVQTVSSELKFKQIRGMNYIFTNSIPLQKFNYGGFLSKEAHDDFCAGV